MSSDLLFRARRVLPVSRPAIENGAIFVRDGVIHDVGSWGELSSRWAGGEGVVRDLGEVLIVPGLVNAHCHLDYTGMAGMISPPARGAFPEWIAGILSLKAHWSYTDYAESWVKGARQLVASGCTTVGDIEAVPELLPEAWGSARLRVISFLEMTGVRSGNDPDRILAEGLADADRMGGTDLSRATVSPHALYSTPPRLIEKCAGLALAGDEVLTLHLAESRAEFEMYWSASGPMYDWLKGQRPMDDCGGRSPVKRAWELGILNPNFLAVHVNYLAEGDAGLLGENGCSVAHCPRSHDYFQHDLFPFEELTRAGVNVCLGTDSLATTRLDGGKLPRLNLWDEMRAFAGKFATVAPEEILRMGTLNGARALKIPAGAIEANRVADFAVAEAKSMEEAMASRGRVRTFVGGVEVSGG